MIGKLVFHIGDPKCGSTAIQMAMQSNACSPQKTTIASQPELNASVLANVIWKDNKKRIENQMRDKREWCERNKADIGLISAEFFERVTPGQFDAVLREYLPEYRKDVQVIAYVRPHASRVISGYAQRIKTGTFTGSVNDFTDKICAGKYLQYYPRFLRWRKLLNKQFILRPFIRSELKGNDVVDDFFSQVLQGEEYQLCPVKPANESLSVEELAGLKFVQECLIQGDLPKYLRFTLGAAVARELGIRSNRFQTKILLDKANAEKIYARFKEDAQVLDKEFFQKSLMDEELQKAVDNSVKSPASLQARDLLPSHTIKKLYNISKMISNTPLEKISSWRIEYQIKKGQIPADSRNFQHLRSGGSSENEVWSAVDEIASLLLP